MENSKLNRLDFYKILQSIVQAYPAPTINAAGFKTAPQLNSFAVLAQQADFNTNNFAKSNAYLSKDFYFQRNPSKNTIEILFPALVVLQQDINMNLENDSLFASFQFIFLDYPPTPTDGKMTSANSLQNGNTVRNRVDEEIVTDLEEMAGSVIKELMNFVYAHIFPDVGTDYYAWASSEWLDSQQNLGNLTYRELDQMNYRIAPNNRAITGGVKINGKDSLSSQAVGIVWDITVQLTNCAVRSFEYTTIPKTVTPQICQ